MNNQERYITAEEAANFLQINVYTVYKWALQRRIPSYKDKKSRRFKISELAEFMEKRKVTDTE